MCTILTLYQRRLLLALRPSFDRIPYEHSDQGSIFWNCSGDPGSEFQFEAVVMDAGEDPGEDAV